MRTVWLVLAAGFRGQWRSWLLLGVLIAVASGFVLAATAAGPQAWLIVALAAGALIAANTLAAVPAMSAARPRPGPLLRTE